MKKLTITGLATAGFALAAFGQGGIYLDNSYAGAGVVSSATTGPSLSGYGYFSGTIGLQVWELNGTNAADVSTINGMYKNPAAAYAELTSLGFTLETTYVGYTITAANAGVIYGLGELDMPNVTPAMSEVTLALAGWTGSGSTFASGASAGTTAFFQATDNYNQIPTPTAPDLADWGTSGNGTDLILYPVPEPATFALAGLGAAALMLFRRHRANR